jgi:hypothetical protein
MKFEHAECNSKSPTNPNKSKSWPATAADELNPSAIKQKDTEKKPQCGE